MNLSVLMVAYNEARRLSRKGILEEGRVNRALGILMTPGKLEAKRSEYGSTSAWCDCPDSRYRLVHCKHSVAVAIAQLHDRLLEDIQSDGQTGAGS